MKNHVLATKVDDWIALMVSSWLLTKCFCSRGLAHENRQPELQIAEVFKTTETYILSLHYRTRFIGIMKCNSLFEWAMSYYVIIVYF